MGSKQTEKTTVDAPPPTEAELALQTQQLTLGQAQLDAINRQQTFTQQLQRDFLEAQPNLTPEQQQQNAAILQNFGPGGFAGAARTTGAIDQGSIRAIQSGEQQVNEAVARGDTVQANALRQQLDQLKAQISPDRTLLALQGDLLKQQGTRVEQQLANEQLQAEGNQALQQQQLLNAQNAAARSEELRPVEQQLLQEQLGLIQGAQQPTEQSEILLQNLRNAAQSPEQIREALNQQANLAIESGTADIESSIGRLGRQLRLNLAPQRGLRPGDSPILDRGGEIVRTGVEQSAQLVRAIRGAEFGQQAQVPFQVADLVGRLGGQSAGLDLQRQGFASSVASGQQNLVAGAQQFQQQLADAAAQNRLALSGQFFQGVNQAGGLGLGLATGVNAGTAGALGNFQNFRLGTAGTTRITTGSPGIGQLLGGLGGLASGLGAIGAGGGLGAILSG